MRLSRAADIYTDPLKVFIIFGLLFGIIFVFLTPPYQVSDEDNHFYRAYQVSELVFWGHKTQVGPGGVLPRSLKVTKDSYNYLAEFQTNKVNFKVLKAGLTRPLKSHDTIPISFPNTVLYPPLAYVPQALGMLGPRLLQLPPLILMYAARLFTLVAWLVLVYLAIKITPIGKWAFCVLALLPMSLFSGASLSADAVTNGLSFLAAALFFYYAMTKAPIGMKQYVVMLAVSIGLALCKTPYFMLAALFILIPIAKFKSKKHYVIFSAALILSVAITLGAWAALTKGLYANYRVTYDFANGHLIHVHKQAIYVIEKPFKYAGALYNTYFTGQGDARIVGFVGMLGWLTFLPLWSVILNYGLIAVALSPLSVTDEKKLIPLGIWRKLLIAALGVAIIIAFTTIAYATYTPLGKTSVDGIQGRYFIAISVLLVAFFAAKPRSKISNYKKLCMWTTIGIGVMLVSSVVLVFYRYYVPVTAVLGI